MLWPSALLLDLLFSLLDRLLCHLFDLLFLIDLNLGRLLLLEAELLQSFRFSLDPLRLQLLCLELFGSLLGLAIYNQVILDVKFPPALYKKLMGCESSELGLSDLMDFQPTLARGLIQLLS